MIEEIKQDAQERMSKSIDSLDGAFAKIRTGRAHLVCWTVSGFLITALKHL